jgi:hypothetical protein
MNTIITSAERELRTAGTLSDTTCRSFTTADDQVRHGFEACFAFLGCAVVDAPISDPPVPVDSRITAIRLMMLRLRVHTDDPRWSSQLLERMIEAALQPPGAQLSDIMRAFFSLLAEPPPGLSDTQANLIRDIGVHVVGKQRRRYAVENLDWFAELLLDQNSKPTAAQAYLAAYTLPPALAAQCVEPILQALRSTRFEEEVKQLLE